MKRRVLSILVDNTSGVLSRVSGLFSRRNFNIDSLTVGVTADPHFSRVTVAASGDDAVLEQITKQLSKLVDVRDIKVLEPDNAVYRELVLVKIRCDESNRSNVISIAGVFRTKIVDVSNDSLIVEITGAHSKINAFLELLEGYEILELARTGLTGLSRGAKDIRYLEEFVD